MNFNVNINIESNRGKFVSHVETSSPGRAQRQVLTSDSFEQALKDIGAEYERQKALIVAYHNPAPAPTLNASADSKAARAKGGKTKADA